MSAGDKTHSLFTRRDIRQKTKAVYRAKLVIRRTILFLAAHQLTIGAFVLHKLERVPHIILMLARYLEKKRIRLKFFPETTTVKSLCLNAK